MDGHINFISFAGLEKEYEPLVREGDHDYSNFWKRVEDNPEDSTFSAIEDGLAKLQEGQYVLHTVESNLRAFFKRNPYHHQELQLFARDRPVFYNVLLTKNNPLAPTLQMGVMRMRQMGMLQKIMDKWQGKLPPGADTMSDTKRLSFGHVVSLYIMMGMVMVFSLVIFVLELLMHQMNITAKI